MLRELEPLPAGTGFMDVIAAAQAAWLANDYTLARDLIQRYIDPNGEFCCMRCSSMEQEPWRINTGTAGTFFACTPCVTIISADKQFMHSVRGDENGVRSFEIYMEGPKQRTVQKTQRVGVTSVEVHTEQRHITLVKR